MGASASKPARSAAQAASRRQYPKQPTTTPSPPSAAARSRPSPPKSPSPSPSQSQSQSPPAQHPESRPAPGPKYHSKEQASTVKSTAIDLDGRDPDFAASLRSIGPVTPFPTLSHSSTVNQRAPAPSSPHHQSSSPVTGSSTPGTIFPPAANPAMLVIAARQRIAKEAEQEAEQVGQSSFAGREFLDAVTIRQVLAMRDRQGLGAREIERVLRLKEGVVGRLGAKGIVSEAV